MGSSYFYIVIFLVSVFVASVSQILLKKAALRTYKNRLGEYLNPLVIGAYSLFFGSTLLTVIAYKGVEIQLGPLLEATGYIYVAVLSKIFLKEHFTKKKIIGFCLIIVGVVITVAVK